MANKNPKTKRQFRCTQCNLAFLTNRILQNHLRCHDLKYYHELTCHVCHRGFTTKSDRDKHVQQVHFKEKNFSCEYCLQTFFNRGGLNVHIHQHHLPENLNRHLTRYQCEFCDVVLFGITERHVHLKTVHKTYKCQLCEKSFTSKQSLLRHTRGHTNKIPFTCDICQKSFRHVENLNRHKKVHFQTKSFTCQTCGKGFFHEKGLRNHITYFHEKHKKPYRCVFCPASYVLKSEMEDHIRSHTQEKPYQCNLCSNCYQESQGLRYHTRAVHSTERKFKCEICEKTFPNRTNLNGHKLIHSTNSGEKKHKCLYCSKSFIRRDSWRSHKIIHLVEMNKIQKWNCIFCEKRFSNSTNLNRHLLSHVHETPYMCGICGKEFSTNFQVQSHMVSHTGERAYKCKICEASYPYPKSLIRHVQSHHEGIRLKPLECLFCDRKFDTRAQLWDHVRCHIKEKPYGCSTCNIEMSNLSSFKQHIKSRKCKQQFINVCLNPP